MSEKIGFASIEELPLKKYFETEDRHFTPWLQENIDKLGDIIGIDIDNAKTEVPIGNYRLDILAYESGTDRTIAIENQYGKTDHSHLGQLITYMAGKNAEVVVWLAEEFNSEHISAINHLNQISDDNIAFFCIKPRLIKIGESKPAIEFVIIAKPDEWEKQVKGEAKLSEREIVYKKFWVALLEKYKEKYPDYQFRRAIPTRSYCIMCYGGSSIEYSVSLKKNSVYLLLYFRYNAKPDPHKLIDGIIRMKSKIEDKLGLELEIHKKDDVRSTYAQIKIPKDVDILTASEKEKKYLMDWVLEWLPKFKNTMDPVIKEVQEN